MGWIEQLAQRRQSLLRAWWDFRYDKGTAIIATVIIVAIVLAAFGAWPWIVAGVLYAMAFVHGLSGAWVLALSIIAGMAFVWVVWWYL